MQGRRLAEAELAKAVGLNEVGHVMRSRGDNNVGRIESALEDAVIPSSLDDTLILFRRLRDAMQDLGTD